MGYLVGASFASLQMGLQLLLGLQAVQYARQVDKRYVHIVRDTVDQGRFCYSFP